MGWMWDPQPCFDADFKTGAKTVTLKAPPNPGIHYILFDRNQNYGQKVSDYGSRLCRRASAPSWSIGTPPKE
jgi:hypothetical protein